MAGNRRDDEGAGMTDARPEVPVRVITPADVRASIRRARKSLEDAANEVVWQIEMEAWRTLGYSSWTAMREAEYGGAAFMVPSKSRPEIVARIRAKGLMQQEIADTAGVSQKQVSRDLNSHLTNEPPATITNSRGQQRPATYQRTQREDDVIDAEVIEDSELHVDTQTGEVIDAPHEKTDPAATESVTTTTCPTCHGTGKVTR